MKKLYHPSCEQCKRMALHATGDEGAPRFFCIGKRIAGEAVCKIDQYNFCVYTPYKGVVQFQVWEGDMEIWIALFTAARELIVKDKGLAPTKFQLNPGWLECMYDLFTKEANRKGPCDDCEPPGGCVLSKYIEGTGVKCERKESLKGK